MKDFEKGVYDSNLRLRRISELRDIHARHIHNFRVVAPVSSKRKNIDTQNEDTDVVPRRVRPRRYDEETIRVGRSAQLSGVADSASNWSWNFSEVKSISFRTETILIFFLQDLFLLELFLTQYLVRAPSNLPENIRMLMLKKHAHVTALTAEDLEAEPSDVMFTMIAKEYHDGLNDYGSATYPVQSLRDKNYEVCFLMGLTFNDILS